MADVFLFRRQIFLAALESTYGVDANPTHTASYQAIKLMEPFTPDFGQENVEVSAGLLTRGFSRPIGTVRPAGITFRTYVHGLDSGSYTANRKPPIGDLLRACAAFETFVSSNADGQPEYQYAPAQDVGSDGSVTLVAHIDGFEHRLVGCRGNVNFIYGAAAPVVAEFNLRGQLTTEAATTRSTSVSLPVQIPPRWIGSGSIFIGSLAANVENLNFSTNNAVLEQRASAAASGSGIIAVLLPERAPGGSFDPEASQPSSFDFFGSWRSTSGAVLRLQAGTSQGNRFTLIASQTVLKKNDWGNKTGLAIFNVDYQCYERGGDDEYLLRFT